MTTVLLLLAVVALLVIAISSVATVRTLVKERRRLDLLTERLATENRIDQMTRATLHAMRESVQHPSFD